jgi:hypothetical protein
MNISSGENIEIGATHKILVFPLAALETPDMGIANVPNIELEVRE